MTMFRSMLLLFLNILSQHAMSVMGLTEDERDVVLSLISAVLHLGNISYDERDNYAAISDEACKPFLLHFCQF